MNLSNASSFRRMACGLCALVGPALLFLASIVDPTGGSGDDEREFVQALKDDPDMVQLSTALSAVGFALTVVAIVGIVHVIRNRGVVLANLAGVLAVFGMVMFVALSAVTVNQLNEAEHLNLETAVALSGDIEDYWVVYVVLVPALLGTLLGLILLGAAVIRSGIAHSAAGVLIIVGVCLLPFSDIKALAVLGNALLLVGFALVGLKLLGMKDEEWDGRVPLGSGTPGTPGAPPANV